MELYPHYKFLQSQPQLYDFIKQDYPEIYQQIKRRIAEGRWEANGAMWVEADCNLTSGESLVRQILYGKKFFKEEFNVDSDYLWLPDVFGYSWALPQILKKSGVKTFITSKISWNQYNKIPHDTFKWKGIDGSEILTHMITTPYENQSKESWYYTYNGVIHANTVNETWTRYVDKDINQELLFPYGHGDGGGGVEREMLEMIPRLDAMPGLPKVITKTACEFFEGLHERINETDRYVHEWDGELYLEYHRGTYTSQAIIKRLNRKLENKYRDIEILSSLTMLAEGNWNFYNQPLMEKGWKIILTNQFHDIIPGSSIKEVYLDAIKDYSDADAIVSNVQKQNHIVLNQENTFSVFNSSIWTRTDLVYIPIDQVANFYDSKGEKLLAQQTNNGWLVKLDDMSPLAFTEISIKLEEVEIEVPVFIVNDQSIITPFYEIELNEFGQFSRLYDRFHNREVLSKGKRGNVLQVFEDKPLNFDAWDIDLFYQEKMSEISKLNQMEIIENGPLRLVIRQSWSYLNSTIIQDLVFYTHSRRIDFKTKVDWQERNQLMKVAFPVDIRSTKATYDIQFGNVERPTHWNTSWDFARFEVVGHKWADLSEGDYGVSLLNDCKYGYDIFGNVMRLTLLKSAIYPDPTADLGHHEFTYSLYPHHGDWKQGETEIESWYLNNPVDVYTGKSKVMNQSILKCMDHHLEIDAIKKAEYDHDLIVRFHEYKGIRKSIVFNSDFEIDSWQEVDLMEIPIGDVVNSNDIELKVNPYEIKTLKVKFKI